MNDTPTPREEFEEWLETFYDNSNILSPRSLAWEAWQAASKELTAAREKIEMLKNAIANNNDAARAEYIELKEQRDTMADLVKQFIYILDITEESDGGRLFHPTNITSCRTSDLQKIGEIVEALRKVSKKV